MGYTPASMEHPEMPRALQRVGESVLGDSIKNEFESKKY
jgi:hypothetical protein